MHSDAKRFYAVLALDPTASDEAVRLAFRRRAKELHPDSPTGDAEAFIWLKRAYDTLSDPEQRAKYDLACQPAPEPEPPHRWAQPRPPMHPPLRPSTRRRGGASRARYVVAFIIVAAVSLGGVQAMISLTEAPPSIQTRNVSRIQTVSPAPESAVSGPLVSGPSVSEATKAPGSSKSGFWDPTPAPAAKQ